jgi:hypothetical protein
MKSGLRLNAEEEELWGRSNPPSRTAPRACGFLQEDQGDNLSPTERLTAKADGLAECTASLEKIVEAAKTLFGSLGDAQKHKFITFDACSCPSVALCEGDEASSYGEGRSARHRVVASYTKIASASNEHVHRPASGRVGPGAFLLAGPVDMTRLARRRERPVFANCVENVWAAPSARGCRGRQLISLLRRIRPRSSPPGQDGDTHAPVLIKLL